MGLRTIREKVVDAHTSAASGTAVVATLLALGGRALDEFEELLVYLDVNTALIGSSPTMRIYLQRAVVPDPDPATDAHWDDLFCFLEITPASSQEQIIPLPVRPWGAVARELATWGLAREHAAQAPNEVKLGHWGDRLRIVEKMGGTVSTEAVYDISMSGLLRVSE